MEMWLSNFDLSLEGLKVVIRFLVLSWIYPTIYL